MTLTLEQAVALWEKGLDPTTGLRLGTRPGVIEANHRFLVELTPDGKGLHWLALIQSREQLRRQLGDSYYSNVYGADAVASVAPVVATPAGVVQAPSAPKGRKRVLAGVAAGTAGLALLGRLLFRRR